MRSVLLCVLMLGIVLAGASAFGSATPGNPPPTDRCLMSVTVDPGTPTETSLRLSSITPQAGALVDMTKTLQADLSWSVQDFQPGRFKITVQLGKNMGSPPRGNTFSVESAVGKVHFCVPLSNVWYLVYGERSFAVRFVLNQVLEGGKSQSVATTDKATFAEPMETMGPTSAAPESLGAYDAALVKVYSMLEWFAADSRYCTKQFPELAHGVNESFERWKQKYDLFIPQIAKETGHDVRTTRRTAEMFREGARREAEQDVAKHTPEELRDMCQKFTSLVGENEPGGWFLSEFAIRQGMQQETGGAAH